MFSLFPLFLLSFSLLPLRPLCIPRATLSSSKKTCLSQPSLICHLYPTANQTARAIVTFHPVYRALQPAPTKCRTLIQVYISHASMGNHAIHIHTYGDLGSTAGLSLGGHYSTPWGADRPHGWNWMNKERRHWGDLGNVSAGKEGKGILVLVDKVIALHAVVGRGIVLHEGPDLGPDAQPSGGAGGRIAVGVIGFANPDSL